MRTTATELPPEYHSPETRVVVVVGAGPAGLVTCKSLLEAATPNHPFEPIILEQEDDIGGTFKYRSYEVTNQSPSLLEIRPKTGSELQLGFK